MFDFFLDNDNLAILGKTKPLTNERLGTVISDATVLLTIKDTAGTDLAGISWPLTMDAVGGSDGKYDVVVGKDAELVKGTTYIAEIVVAAPGGLGAKWSVPFIASVRT